MLTTAPQQDGTGEYVPPPQSGESKKEEYGLSVAFWLPAWW